MRFRPIYDRRNHFRKIGREGARESSLELREALKGGAYRWIMEADIWGFFDPVDPNWMARTLELRIADRPLVRLIVKCLKAGVMDEGSNVIHPATVPPQGGVISTILANIYQDHVQDEWIRKVVAKRCKGRVLFRRYGGRHTPSSVAMQQVFIPAEAAAPDAGEVQAGCFRPRPLPRPRNSGRSPRPRRGW